MIEERCTIEIGWRKHGMGGKEDAQEIGRKKNGRNWAMETWNGRDGRRTRNWATKNGRVQNRLVLFHSDMHNSMTWPNLIG